METQAPGLAPKEVYEPELIHQATGLWGKSVSFEVKGEPLYRYIYPEVQNKLHSVLGIEPYSNQNSNLFSELSKLDFSNYFLNKEGPKVTKLIRKVLKKELSPEEYKEFEPKFPELFKQVRELYLPQTTLTAYWGEKSMIGEGKWEGSSTCFSTDGCNSVSKKFVGKFDRVQALVLAMGGVETVTKFSHYEDIKCGCAVPGCTNVQQKLRYTKVQVPTTIYSRCLVYFLGGRVINLTNFYYRKGIPQNYRLHVEALRRLLGLRKVTFKSTSIKLPIYLNSDAIEVRCEERSKEYEGVRKFPCPHCGNKVDEYSFHSGFNDNTYFLGCSEECLGVKCCQCDAFVNKDDLMTNENGDEYCPTCYNDSYTYCNHCSSGVLKENYDSTNNICYSCGVRCRDCGSYFHSDNIQEVDGRSYCQECFDRTYTTCTECDEVIMKIRYAEDKCQPCIDKEKEEGVGV